MICACSPVLQVERIAGRGVWIGAAAPCRIGARKQCIKFARVPAYLLVRPRSRSVAIGGQEVGSGAQAAPVAGAVVPEIIVHAARQIRHVVGGDQRENGIMKAAGPGEFGGEPGWGVELGRDSLSP